jgi:predicted ATPase/DNA-binding SARP family transcriptional activator
MDFGILGLLLVHDGDTQREVAGARQRVLLAALLLHTGQVVSADALAEIVWDCAPPAGAEATLRTHVMRLRRVLGPVAGARVVTRPPGYLLRAGASEVDLLRFAASCRDGGRAAKAGDWPRAWQVLGQALGQWRGPALADVSCQVLHRDEVPRLEQQRLQAAEWHIEAGLQLGRHGELVTRLQDLAAEHPLRERFHAQLMLALHRCGRQAEALAAYRRARTMLADELGVEPGPELQQLHQRILAGNRVPSQPRPGPRPSAAVPAPAVIPGQGHAGLGSSRPGGGGGSCGSLPRPLTSFIGRERELAEARRLLEGTFLLTLTGPGGSGKTRLCIELATRVAGGYPDGVCFVPLAPVGDPGLVASSIAQHIGLQDSRGRPLVEHLVSQLRDRKLLIVLDNFEHLLAAAPVVAELLQGTRAVRFVVSSRSCLRVSGEQECPVSPLALPEQHPLAGPLSVADCESVRLFAERAAAVVPGFTVGEQNAGAVAQIVRRLDGLPLAIELAATRVKLLPPEAILARLEHSLGLLVGGGRELPDRQRTLRGTIAWSHDLLGDGARRLLAACSVFRGGVSLEVIESVCLTATDIGMPVLEGLAELVDHSLLRQARPLGGPRYAMLETIREFAGERLAGMPDAARIRACHAAAFLALAGKVGRPLTGPAHTQWLERLDAEHNNIRAALDWYLDEDPLTALRLAAAMSAYWSLHGHFSEGRRRLRELLALVPDQNSVRVSALNGAAWLAMDQGDTSDAEGLLAESIDLARRLGDRVGEGMATAYQARNKVSSHRAGEAAHDVQQALELLDQDPPGLALALFYSGLVARFSGQPEAARARFARCAAMSEKLGFEPLRGRALQLLGHSQLDLGDLTAARTALQEGLPVTAGVGDRFVIPIGLCGFAGLAAKSGRPLLALRLAGAAEAYRQANETSMPEPVQMIIDRWLAPARTRADAAAGRVFAEGAKMTLAQAVACALANEPEPAGR